MPPRNQLKIPAELIAFLSHLPPTIKQKIRGGLDALLANPQEGKPLKAELSGLWSLRISRFRIIYKLSGSVLEVIAIGPRSTIYEEATRMKKIKAAII